MHVIKRRQAKFKLSPEEIAHFFPPLQLNNDRNYVKIVSFENLRFFRLHFYVFSYTLNQLFKLRISCPQLAENMCGNVKIFLLRALNHLTYVVEFYGIAAGESYSSGEREKF